MTRLGWVTAIALGAIMGLLLGHALLGCAPPLREEAERARSGVETCEAMCAPLRWRLNYSGRGPRCVCV